MRKNKVIYAGVLASAMLCSICVPAAADDEAIKLITAELPFDYHGYPGEGIHAIEAGGVTQLIRISADDIAAFGEDGELSYTTIVDDCDKFFDCGEDDGVSWFSNQRFRNGYAQFVKLNANDEQISRYVVYYDGEELSIIDEFTPQYCTVSPNGYVHSSEWGDSELTLRITAPDGSVNTLTLENALYTGGFNADSTDISVLTYEVIEENYWGTEHSMLGLYLNIIDENGDMETISVGEGIYVSGYHHGDNFDFFAASTAIGKMETPFVYLYDSNEVIEIDTLSLETAAKGVYEKTLAYVCDFGDHVYDGVISVAFTPNNDSEPCWALVDLNEEGKAVSGVYQDMSTEDGEIYLVQDFDGKWGYINSDGEELAMFDDAGVFFSGSEYAPVIKDGKAYLIDRNMEIVSEGVEADSVAILYADFFYYESGDKSYFMTYTEAKTSDIPSEDTGDTSDEQPAPDTDEGGEDSAQGDDTASDIPTDEETGNDDASSDNTDEDANKDDTDNTGDTESADDESKTSAETGAEGVAAAAAIALTAVGAAVLSRRKR